MEKKTLVESAQRWLDEDTVILKEEVAVYKLMVKNMVKEVAEDNFEEGEVGQRSMTADEKVGKIFDSMLDFKEYCAKTWGLEYKSEDEWTVIDNRLIYTRTEDEEGNEVTTKDPQWEEFKQGKIKLYNADYDFVVELISQVKSDEDSIREYTGIKN